MVWIAKPRRPRYVFPRREDVENHFLRREDLDEFLALHPRERFHVRHVPAKTPENYDFLSKVRVQRTNDEIGARIKVVLASGLAIGMILSSIAGYCLSSFLVHHFHAPRPQAALPTAVSHQPGALRAR